MVAVRFDPRRIRNHADDGRRGGSRQPVLAAGCGPLSRPSQSADRTDPADSYREFRRPFLALVVSIATAGALDAFAFLRYGVFVANQSGNAVFLGIGPAGGHPAWPAAAVSLIAFAAGAGVVSWLRGLTRRWPAPLTSIVATELALALWTVLNVLLGYGRDATSSAVAMTATGAFAMGSLTTLFSRTAGIATAITYQSMTTASTGERAVRWLLDRGAGRTRARTGTLLGLLAIASYAAGGAIGTFAQHRPHWVPLWGGIALATLILLIRRDANRS